MSRHEYRGIHTTRERANQAYVSRSESRCDPRSEEQISQIADAWINQRIRRFSPNVTLGLAMAMKGDPRLYQAITDKLQDEGQSPDQA